MSLLNSISSRFPSTAVSCICFLTVSMLFSFQSIGQNSKVDLIQTIDEYIHKANNRDYSIIKEDFDASEKQKDFLKASLNTVLGDSAVQSLESHAQLFFDAALDEVESTEKKKRKNIRELYWDYSGRLVDYLVFELLDLDNTKQASDTTKYYVEKLSHPITMYLVYHALDKYINDKSSKYEYHQGLKANKTIVTE